MKNQKIELNINIVTAICCSAILLGGWTAALLTLAYALFVEDNTFLRKTVTKAFSVMALCGLARTAFSLLPQTISTISGFLSIFGGHLYIGFLSELVSAVNGGISLFENGLLLLIAIKAFRGKETDIESAAGKLMASANDTMDKAEKYMAAKKDEKTKAQSAAVDTGDAPVVPEEPSEQ